MRAGPVILGAILAAGCHPGSSGGLRVVGTVASAGAVPRPGIAVAIAAHGTDAWAQTRTDAAGRFALDWDGAPYDLAVIQAPGGGALLYTGLQRGEVTVVYVTGTNDPLPSGLRTGRIEGAARDCGGGACLSSGVCAVGQLSMLDTAGVLGASKLPPAFSVDASWLGGLSPTGRLLDLWWSEPCASGTLPPASPYLLGQADVTLQAGGTVNVGALAYAPAPAGTLHGHVVLPPGVQADTLTLAARMTDHATGLGTGAMLWSAPAPSAGFALTVPDIPRLRVSVGVQGRAAGGGTVYAGRDGASPGPADIALALRRPPDLVDPADGALLPPSRLLRWTPVEGAAYDVFLWPTGFGGIGLSLHTTETSVRIPDLSALGLPWPAGAALAWSVSAGPAGDPFAAPATAGPPVDWWGASSAARALSIPP